MTRFRPLLAALLIAGTTAAAPLTATAAEHTIRMLNYGPDGSMVFDPPFLKTAVGDTVTFVPENSGHFVQSYATPDGVTPWKSAADQPFTVTLEKEGVYLYVCPPHLMMAMIGVIQTGAATNLDAVTEKANRLRPKLVMKGERLEQYLSRVGK
ncbi:plastocyanin/azurin family copper-binding protein [Novispirillum itersonii]|uniref:Pseudoazurin n=1 Tax=Novispirillum itersonii TaxID=189 RepID=A0A7W9ZC98_NOVIT|nr:plastocyanin/azurin family copper-binding protein [Novispirillum itersonii]MBB6208837.1 pseudoazurin [Novispirillum itersonii]